MKNPSTIIFALILAYALLGCTRVIDSTIPLTRNFEENSELITIGNIDFLFTDSKLNKKLGEYEVLNADVSWKKGSEIDRKRTSHSDWTNLFTSYPISWHVDVIHKRSVQTYSFDLVRDGSVKNRPKCEITLEIKVTIDERYHDSYSDGYEDILYTDLICSFNDEDANSWRLRNFTGADRISNLTLNSEEQKIHIRLTDQMISYGKVDGEIEYRASPLHLKLKSGALLFDGDKQIAAVSFVGAPKIWFLKELPQKQKEILLSTSYSLIIFNRLESKWR